MSEQNPYIESGSLVEGVNFLGTSGRLLAAALKATGWVGVVVETGPDADGDYLFKLVGCEHEFYTHRVRVLVAVNQLDEYEDALAAQDAMAKIEGKT